MTSHDYTFHSLITQPIITSGIINLKSLTLRWAVKILPTLHTVGQMGPSIELVSYKMWVLRHFHIVHPCFNRTKYALHELCGIYHPSCAHQYWCGFWTSCRLWMVCLWCGSILLSCLQISFPCCPLHCSVVYVGGAYGLPNVRFPLMLTCLVNHKASPHGTNFFYVLQIGYHGPIQTFQFFS